MNFQLFFNPRFDIQADGINKHTGYTLVRDFINIIRFFDLQINPRESKVNAITKGIESTLYNQPELFPFMTKGILTHIPSLEYIENNKIFIRTNEEIPLGIIDGGHNTLAIGRVILTVLGFPHKNIKLITSWDYLKGYWEENYFLIQKRAKFNKNSILDTIVPIEIISGYNQDLTISNKIIEISSARNTNAQIKSESLINQRGFFDIVKKNLPSEYSSRIIWKTNSSGDIDVKYLLSLLWIPLGVRFSNLYHFPGNTAYSSKQEVLNRYTNLVERFEDDFYMRESFISCVSIMPDILRIHDYIVTNFENVARELNSKILLSSMNKHVNSNYLFQDYTDRSSILMPPLGFIYPILYGLRENMDCSRSGEVQWLKCPNIFTNENFLETSIDALSDVAELVNGDPQKIGKLKISYETLSSSTRKYLMKDEPNKNINGLKRR